MNERAGRMFISQWAVYFQLCVLTLLISGCTAQGDLNKADIRKALETSTPEIWMVANDTAIYFLGPITANASENFAQVLDANPKARVVIMDSPGGIVSESMKMAKLISTHALDTHSERGCYSACTYAYIAGAKRTLAKSAKLGFHQISGFDEVSGNKAELDLVQDRVRRLFASRRVASAFRKQLFSVPSDEFWIPNFERLTQDGVIHEVTRDDQYTLVLVGS